ncbi:hypothetical protein GCM10022289_12150 [Pedobacter jeongneungensis]|uniref:DKNYY family protein n=1 Tax=Pedobacter jeongneungensis TaxID=947309 RepID=A0ABP8B7Z8_9SPHI
MTRKNILITIAILLVLLVIYLAKFTAIHIALSNLSFPSRLKHYPYLNEGAQSENFEVDYLFYDPANIDYDTKTGGFIVTTAHVNQAFEVYHKLDAKGNSTDSLVNDTSAIHTFHNEGVVFGEDYFIDWCTSGNKNRQPFVDFLNHDFKMDEKAWAEIFETHYKNASAVTYKPSKDWHSLTFYFKTEKGWLAMNSLKDDERIFQDVGSENELDFKGYPLKGNRFIALKSSITGKYPLLSYKNRSDIENQSYNWKDSKNPVNLKYFKKENLQGRAPYTGLPQTWGGDAYLTLKHKNQLIRFKEIAVKDVGFAEPQINLDLYQVPKAFENKSDVAFIILSYGTNIGDRGGNGLYVIKRK